MLCKLFIVFTLVSHAISDSCVRYTFEENYNDWLENQWGSICDQYSIWTTGKYSDLDVTGQNERSTSFIMPQSVLSCVSSFIFTMNVGGTIEANIYMEAAEMLDQIIILANPFDEGSDTITGQVVIMAMDPNLVAGWHTLTMTLLGSKTYRGYISFMGMASPNSTVIVDSFRYIPPGMDESECQLYDTNLPGVDHLRFNSFRG